MKLTSEEKQIIDTSWPPEMIPLNRTQRRFVYAAVEAVLIKRASNQDMVSMADVGKLIRTIHVSVDNAVLELTKRQ